MCIKAFWCRPGETVQSGYSVMGSYWGMSRRFLNVFPLSVIHVDGLLAKFEIYCVQRELFPIFSRTSRPLVPPGPQQAVQIYIFFKCTCHDHQTFFSWGMFTSHSCPSLIHLSVPISFHHSFPFCK